MADFRSQLATGQTVKLEDQDFGFRLTLLPADQPGQKLIEIGEDYVVLDDEAAGVKTRIPAHLLRSVGTPPAPVTQAA